MSTSQPIYRGIAHAAPGTIAEAHCALCGTPCIIRRDRVGPTSFATAMARRHTRHDSIVCPHYDASWHRQAQALRDEASRTASPSLRALLLADLDALLRASAPAP